MHQSTNYFLHTIMHIIKNTHTCDADLLTTAGIPVHLPSFGKSTGNAGGSNFSTVFCCQQCFLLFFRGLRKISENGR